MDSISKESSALPDETRDKSTSTELITRQIDSIKLFDIYEITETSDDFNWDDDDEYFALFGVGGPA